MENIKDLKYYWLKLTERFSNDIQLNEKLWFQLESEYAHKSRHYHNLNHLIYMLSKALEFEDKIEDLDTLSFSIFYHDIIYKSIRSDNEEKSAIEAKKSLTRLGLTKEVIEKCQQQIIATKLHNDNDDSDTNYLVDLDLAILGEDRETYHKYTTQIRKEYSIYPDFMYKRGRKKVLNHFMNMERIFKTPEFVNDYEIRARANMQAELSGF